MPGPIANTRESTPGASVPPTMPAAFSPDILLTMDATGLS
jgi:hypothetical protein